MRCVCAAWSKALHSKYCSQGSLKVRFLLLRNGMAQCPAFPHCAQFSFAMFFLQLPVQGNYASLVYHSSNICPMNDGGKQWHEIWLALCAAPGSTVAAALHYIQFGLALNCLQFLVWAILVVIPFLLRPPIAFEWPLFREAGALNLLAGYGMGQTFLLYGTLLTPWTRSMTNQGHQIEIAFGGIFTAASIGQNFCIIALCLCNCSVHLCFGISARIVCAAYKQQRLDNTDLWSPNTSTFRKSVCWGICYL